MKPFWEIEPDEVDACLEATEWWPANLEYFRGGGFSSQFVTRGEMPVTMTRINLISGLGPVLQIAEGYAVSLPDSVHETLNRRTDPNWPIIWFVPELTGEGVFRDVYSVMNNWGSNHGVLSYGHVGDQFITLASMFRIPVSMHNISDERLFRPSVWAAWGTRDPEGADYRVCRQLGPLYGGRGGVWPIFFGCLHFYSIFSLIIIETARQNQLFYAQDSTAFVISHCRWIDHLHDSLDACRFRAE